MSLGFVLLVAVIILCAVIATRPSEFRVTRSGTIAAPASAIFPHVNTLTQWEPWSPWARLDPNAKTTFEGPAEGKGAIMRWDGNRNIGAGSMTILESRPNEFVRFQLDFLKPMKGTSLAEFTFRDEGGKTLVTWSMFGTNNFLAKAMTLVINCEKMVGEQFEKGLANLKSLAEGAK
jgi:uncharacterized protein YndB with AHSA1/START domain